MWRCRARFSVQSYVLDMSAERWTPHLTICLVSRGVLFCRQDVRLSHIVSAAVAPPFYLHTTVWLVALSAIRFTYTV